MAFKYSMDKLKGIRRSMPKRPRIKSELFSKLKELGVYRPFRGMRSGVIRGQHQIPVRIAHNSTAVT